MVEHWCCCSPLPGPQSRVSRDTITADYECHLQRCPRGLRKVRNAEACGAGRLLQAIQRVPEGLELGACVTLSPFSQKRNLQRSGTCPGGTVVSAECADRSAFGENTCACTALQELAALSSFLQNEAPWNDHQANAAYCPTGSLYVECATVGRVQLPTLVGGTSQGLAGRVGRGHVGAPTCRRVSAAAPTPPQRNFAWSRPGRGGGGGFKKGRDGS